MKNFCLKWKVWITEWTIFLIIKPTRCINYSNLFLEWKSTCFGQFLCPSSGVFHCRHCNGICHTGLLTACEQDQDGTHPSWSCSTAVYKPVWHLPLLCVQWKTPDDGQRNCPKHVEFHSKKKFEKLVHLVGFIIRNLSWCMVTWMSEPFFSNKSSDYWMNSFLQEILKSLVRYQFFEWNFTLTETEGSIITSRQQDHMPFHV